MHQCIWTISWKINNNRRAILQSSVQISHIKCYSSIWDKCCLFSTKEFTTDIANVAVQLKNVWHCNCRTVLSVISLCSLLSLIRVCTPWLMLVINWQLLQSSINFAPAKKRIYSHTHTFSRCGHFQSYWTFLFLFFNCSIGMKLLWTRLKTFF